MIRVVFVLCVTVAFACFAGFIVLRFDRSDLTQAEFVIEEWKSLCVLFGVALAACVGAHKTDGRWL